MIHKRIIRSIKPKIKPAPQPRGPKAGYTMGTYECGCKVIYKAKSMFTAKCPECGTKLLIV